jgi:hypothetical protein
VFACPDGYEGRDFRDDCEPGSYDVSDGYLLDSTNEEIIDGFEDGNQTNAQGLTVLNDVPAGTYSLGVGVFRQYNEVYLSCFDVTSGSEDFLFDETITVATLHATPPNNLITIESGRDYSCHYYIIPGGDTAGRISVT